MWRFFVLCVFHSIVISVLSADLHVQEQNPLRLPEIGDSSLYVLSPTVLELTLVTTKQPDPAGVIDWNFTQGKSLNLPPANAFVVRADGKEIAVSEVGFKRRALYAPLRRRDFRIGAHLYLKMASPLPDNANVEVLNPDASFWPVFRNFTAKTDPLRWSSAIHVNQTGYTIGLPKRAMAGYYLGTSGELSITGKFSIIKADSGKPVFTGDLRTRKEVGFNFPTYERVVEADFSAFNIPGEYRLAIGGLGASFAFRIDEGTSMAFLRTYALGLYHQRCGASNALPFTRFTHDPCHIALADIPTPAFKATEAILKHMASDQPPREREFGPKLASIETSLYPFVRQGKIDVSGGHHDAGDYSKYTINSAALIHHLVFAADSFPGAGDLDNLGLPESGDGKSDLLQEAKWEADFLAKLQDSDGGFYFLVYPREREYEDNVLPDKGDPQVVFPKNTSATGAAVAALAQIASSPRFKKQFPEAASMYLKKARLGWKFLETAQSKYGNDGAYQQITHYGHEFLHDDEIAWAAAELYLATGQKSFQERLLKNFDPTSRDTKRWTWWRLYEGYGCAIRSFAFGARSGRIEPNKLDPDFLQKCESEILAAGKEQARFSHESAYATSWPDPDKKFRNAGWYFSMDRAFDLAVAAQLDFPELMNPRTEFLDAVVGNMNYEGGCNPVNVTYLTGLGWKRQHEIVHQYAMNDWRDLPPSGIPLGNIQGGFMFQHHYQKELGEVTHPPDGAEENPYPFYDRWGDSFNTATEFVVVNQARGLATLAWLVGQATNHPALSEKPAQTTLQLRVTQGTNGQASIQIAAPLQRSLAQARIVCEVEGENARFADRSGKCDFANIQPGAHWVEVESQWPDGYRLYGRERMTIK
jgi:hypothetical protein